MQAAASAAPLDLAVSGPVYEETCQPYSVSHFYDLVFAVKKAAKNGQYSNLTVGDANKFKQVVQMVDVRTILFDFPTIERHAGGLGFQKGLENWIPFLKSLCKHASVSLKDEALRSIYKVIDYCARRNNLPVLKEILVPRILPFIRNSNFIMCRNMKTHFPHWNISDTASLKVADIMCTYQCLRVTHLSSTMAYIVISKLTNGLSHSSKIINHMIECFIRHIKNNKLKCIPNTFFNSGIRNRDSGQCGTAALYFEKAIDMGNHTGARAAWALMLVQGRIDLPQNRPKARWLVEEFTECKSCQSVFALISFLDNYFTSAIKIAQHCAQKGNVYGMYVYGLIVIKGSEKYKDFQIPELQVDFTDISRMLEIASMSLCDAKILLAELFNKENDHHNAYQLSENIALCGNLEGIVMLGELRQTGKGCVKDNDSDFKLYEVAAKHGYPHAMYMLAKCYENGIGTRISIEHSTLWSTRAKNKGWLGLKDV